jgi:prenyltransferase beta subunit
MAVALAIAGATGFAALAGAAAPERQHLIDSTVRFLQEHQRPSGGFADPGKKPSQGISAWATLALAATGINPQDQATCGVDAYTYLESHFAAGVREEFAWPATATTAFERELLVVDAAGTDPHHFGGYDLVAEILARQLPDGSFPYVPGGRGEINDTAFAVLALSPVAEPAAQAAAAKATDWLLTQQNDDGGWSWQVKGQAGNVDLTGGALEALSAVGRRGTEAEALALAFLHRVQGPDGGFSEAGGGESNVASTAWAVQGLWASGQDPETWLTGSGLASEEPLDYMESLQQPDGHVRWRASSDMNGIWMTAYVTPAFAGRALPFAAVPRALPPEPGGAAAELPAGCAEPGPAAGEEGGAGAETPPSGPPPPGSPPQAGAGVIAGGGGEGAPDFSRPEPQSKGKTPGGARLVHEGKRRSRDRSPTRRGENARQPRGTESAEPSQPPGGPPPAVVGPSGGPATDAGAEAGAPSPPDGRHGKRAAAGDGAPVPAASTRERSAEGDREISGALIGAPGERRHGKLAFGAPGLRSGEGGGGDETEVGLAIAGLALLGALGGAGWERRRRVALP